MAASILVCLVTGIIIRFCLLKTSLPDWLASRNEVSTPLTSWERVTEGLSLKRNHLSPYSGDLFHETPLMLRALDILEKFLPNYVPYIFVLVDVLTVTVLWKIAHLFGSYMLCKQYKEVNDYHTDSKGLVLKGEDLHWNKLYIVIVHMFNPYSVASCLAKSTAVFNNFFILMSIQAMLSDNEILCTLLVAIATYQSFYPIVLGVPVSLYFYKKSYPNRQTYIDPVATQSYTKTTGLCFLWLALLLGLSFYLEESWDFFQSTYGFILTVPDLTPNMGVFWYFFTEMFEHFRSFFICVFQINAIIYTVPLAVKLRDHPVFLMYLLIFIIGIFKSYPSYADASLYLSLLPLWSHVIKYMRNKFIIACMFISATVFAPILWHLWIFSGSANANFYFAIALVFSTAEIFLVTDTLYGFLRREYDLHHGIEHKLPDGKPANVVLG